MKMTQRSKRDFVESIVRYFNEGAREKSVQRIITLLFLRYLSEPDFSAQRFDIPESATWDTLRRQLSHLGDCIDTAFEELRQKNVTLAFTEDLPTFRNVPDVLLSQAIVDLSRVSGSDLAAINYLLLEMAGGAQNRHESMLLAPLFVSSLLVQLLNPQEAKHIHDPTCATGGTFLACNNFLLDQNIQNTKRLAISGQEEDKHLAALCQAQLFMNGIHEHDIRCGDVLSNPRFTKAITGENPHSELETFDIVVGIPPFGVRGSNYDFENDTYGRFSFGRPRQSNMDAAFIQHWLAAMNAQGRGAIVIPQGILFSYRDKAIRQRILTADVVEAVIGLPGNLFYNTYIAVSILVFNKNKPQSRRNQVLFIDSNENYQKQYGGNYLSAKNIKKIVDAYQAFDNIEAFARVVHIDDIVSKDFSLSINNYVFERISLQTDVYAKLAELKVAEHSVNSSQRAVDEAIRDLGFDTEPEEFLDS